MFSLDTGNGFYVSLSVDMNVSKQKINVVSVTATGVLSVMRLLSLQSVFSRDKDLSGFQPRDDPIRSEYIVFCLNAGCNINLQDL